MVTGRGRRGKGGFEIKLSTHPSANAKGQRDPVIQVSRWYWSDQSTNNYAQREGDADHEAAFGVVSEFEALG